MNNRFVWNYLCCAPMEHGGQKIMEHAVDMICEPAVREMVRKLKEADAEDCRAIDLRAAAMENRLRSNE